MQQEAIVFVTTLGVVVSAALIKILDFGSWSLGGKEEEGKRGEERTLFVCHVRDFNEA